MASTHIKVNGTGTRHNQQLRAFIDRLQDVVDDAARLKAIYDQAASGEDYASLALVLDVTQTEAEALYALVGSVNTELSGATFIPQLLSRAG